MGSPRSHAPAGQSRMEGPLRGRAARIRQELAERRERLEEYDEVGALDTTARLLDRLMDELSGSLVSVSADRSPRYFRKQLAGERSLPLEDLVHLALFEPRAGRALLTFLAEAFGYEPPIAAPGTSSGKELAEELADVIEASAATLATYTRAMGDGHLAGPEIAALEHLVEGLFREVLELKTAIRRTE